MAIRVRDITARTGAPAPAEERGAGAVSAGRPITVPDLIACKGLGQRFAMVTAYDYTMASIAAAAEIPVLLVGDSLGMVMLGYDSTIPVTMEEMLHHARAVARGAPRQLLVGDMPFCSYHTGEAAAMENAVAFLQAGMHSVKMEGGGPVIDLVGAMTERGIPVMGHLGLTPQFSNAMGGFRVQGRTAKAAEQIRRDAIALQEAGAFAVVLEGVPQSVAADVTATLAVPTIGIGAGPHCDGQVLVMHDLLGLTQGPVPRFVKAFGDLGSGAVSALRQYATEVAGGAFPDDAHSYH